MDRHWNEGGSGASASGDIANREQSRPERRMKVLVTGHHGYIGSAVVPTLLAADHEVTGLDSFFYDGCDLMGDSAEVASLSMDVRDAEPDHLRGYEAVVHLAALSNDPLGDLSPSLTADINYTGTMRLARAAKAAGVQRFVLSSSCSMYGSSGTEGSVGEETPLRPLTAYAESKVRSEAGLSDLADESFSPVFMRNATAYGVSPRMRMDLVLNNLAAWAYTTGRIRIFSDGTPWRPLVHIEDIAHAVVAVLEAPVERTHNQAFNIGADSENYQVRDLADMVHAAFPDCAIEYAGDGDPDPRSYRVDFGKFARMFSDFELAWNVPRGVDELLSAYSAVELSLDDFMSSRYTRLKRLRELLDSGALDRNLRWAVRTGGAAEPTRA
jgi:nucleoside-diphosphate-sugar epimerase